MHWQNGALICAKSHIDYYAGCNDCMDCRILVWKDGADENNVDSVFTTLAGRYYIRPVSDNMTLCGVWMTNGNNMLIKDKK